MVQDFFNNLDWMLLLRAFLVGGAICVIGQILIDKTKLTPARILVTFVTVGAILGGLGIYQKLVDFAGCGATVPLTGFGNLLAKGAIKKAETDGFIGAFTGVTAAAAGGIAAAIFFGYICFTCCKTKNEKAIILYLEEHRSFCVLLFYVNLILNLLSCIILKCIKY